MNKKETEELLRWVKDLMTFPALFYFIWWMSFGIAFLVTGIATLQFIANPVAAHFLAVLLIITAGGWAPAFALVEANKDGKM